ncbi:MAG: hypothetical protein VX323_02690, partial [Pseudomonadota bacterium]|nr:hypothetical protein [Pseudomonadota bacterium]
MTTSALSDAAQAAYNESAIDLANRMASARSAARAAGIFPKTEDERFPLHNRVPLGVAREYARMGNQPLSDATQALGTQFGARFEHLGLTIGTVIHDVTLRDHDEDAFYAFLRQVLLERKVIFFRDQ